VVWRSRLDHEAITKHLTKFRTSSACIFYGHPHALLVTRDCIFGLVILLCAPLKKS
jgi:hypothetical protein